ncbi:Isochorismatase hydrolase [Rhodotorula sp. JG-1b]|nr:Isochorismatase hydrolase [Rhodotorula sp. JG-1b]
MRRALLLVDVQNDFLPPRGALAVSQGDTILPHVYRLLDEGEWAIVLASQDYHPSRHISFASRWPGGKPFTTQTTQHPRTQRQIRQELWPDHCVQGTPGCELERGVQERLDERQRCDGSDSCIIIQKGTDVDLDAYSAFAVPLTEQDAGSDPAHSTLARLINDADVEQIVVVGLALDFCVRQSVSDAVKARKALGKQWDIVVVREAVKSVNPDQERSVTEDLQAQGVRFLGVQDLLPA